MSARSPKANARQLTDSDDNLDDDTINYNVLNDPNHPNFAKELANATRSIPIDKIERVYATLLGHINDKNLNTKTGGQILMAIRKFCHAPELLAKFTEKDILLLPNKNEEYDNFIFTVVYDLLHLKPSLFTKEFVNKHNFGMCVKRCPHLILSILSRYAQDVVNNKFNFDTPWPFVDILIKESDLFLSTDEKLEYISILIYLCQNDPLFRRKRLNDCWEIVVKALDGKPESRQIYIALNYLRDVYKMIKEMPELPIVRIINDVHTVELQGPLLALLADAADADPLSIRDAELTQKLLNIAERNESLKATVVLMKLSENEKIAREILTDGYWFVKKLPEPVDTLRLFLAIFKHQSLRAEMARLETFIPFLNYMVEELGTPGVLTILCTIVRRVPLSRDVVLQMAKDDFIHNYVTRALEINTEDDSNVVTHSLLLFVNTIAEFCYLPEYNTLLKLVVDTTMQVEALCEIASFVAVTLAHYSQCAEKMIDMRLKEYFEKHLKDKEHKRLAKNAEKFLKITSKYNCQ
ncbi:hypothetical protein TRFO_22712 [Tritrichomonas foetus]|uniref:Uncharacterized protein n=1 Tax=Tritrichomonas foetus TaxID=1144522 RepID=A0A1J4KH19_9EUKA|nr:hypothetical protein TRFO_22712 [Tritrichomonas foetus]|eukprot:OHT08637.1 hypothetical protein TRFO_22712 [Tritrichomonas foetus]